MTSKCARLVPAATGLALALIAVSACSDDSTASAPITNNPVTTTSLYSAAPSATPASSSKSTEAIGSSSAAASAADPSKLPDTGPNPSTKVPESFPGPSGEPLDDKAKAYLAALKAQKVEFMGDNDNSVALTMAKYVCGARQKGTDPSMVKAFVTASVGPGTETVEEANAKADKVIRAAEQHYC
ncbi:DUF732 domain-containing protein [Gordonia aurantiaca]|uniref:DUF732 domain-containing protein n=1 Tax=Gordonia sp. B21 TaxID=3151852 RepID=UPI003263D9D9